MSLLSDAKTNVSKFLINMDRFDRVMNGDINTDVNIDSGSVPSIRKLYEYIKNNVPGDPSKTNYSVYSGGASRNSIDRAKDYIVATDCGPSDGSPASDRMCVQKALDLCAASNGAKTVLLTRPFTNDVALTMAPDCRMEGVGTTSKLSCLTPGGNILNASYLFTLKHILFNRVAGGADIAVKADDPDKVGYTRIIEECTFGSFPVCISSKNGQLLKVYKNVAIGDTGLFIDLAGANYGAEITANNVLGMSGINIGFSTIQCEGIRIKDNEIFPIGAEGQYGIRVLGALRVNMWGNLVGEIRPSCYGILLDGTTNQNVLISLRDNWVGFRSEGPYAANGIVVQGQNREIRILDNDVINVGMSVGAASPQFIDNADISGNFFQGFPGAPDGSGQLELRRIASGKVHKNVFNNSSTGYNIREYGVNRVANDASTFEMDLDVQLNYFNRPCVHLTHTRARNNLGSGAALQFPSYDNDAQAASFGVTLGSEYRRSSDNATVIRAV